MTLFRATVLDTPDNPFTGAALRASSDEGILVRDGEIVARGPFTSFDLPDEEVVTLDGGLLLPGFVDTHVHYPQVRVIGGLGMPLLDWLEQCALPEEARLADAGYAQAGRGRVRERAGRCRHHDRPGVRLPLRRARSTLLFTEAARTGLRVTSGLVVSDRLLRDELLTTPERAYDEGLALARRWHGVGRTRYAVTPRFSLSCSDGLLESCAALLKDVEDCWFTSHINENTREIATVARLFGLSHYLDTYDQHQLVGRRSILAHNVHPTDAELRVLAERDASVSHCPTSNSALGSGLFPLARHLAFGVRVALGSDVGAGTGFSLLKEGLQAYFMQQLLAEHGYHLEAAHLLHLATAAGADALGMADQVGDLSVGKRFDAQWIRPAAGSTFDVALRNATGPEDALAKTFALGTPGDVAAVWIDGDSVAAG